MPASFINQNSHPNDPKWFFLGVYPLKGLGGDVDARDKPIDGMLFNAIRDLGIGAELFDNIERKLLRFIGGDTAQYNEGRFETPVTIRLFCQIENLEDENSMKPSSQLNENRAIKYSHTLHPYDPTTNGGWGYFMVKRGGGSDPDCSETTNMWIDLFLYKE